MANKETLKSQIQQFQKRLSELENLNRSLSHQLEASHQVLSPENPSTTEAKLYETGKLLITEKAERQFAEDVRNEAERRLADIVDFLPDATFVINRNGRVLTWNRAMQELSGIPAEKMLGKGNNEYAIAFHGTRKPVLIDLCHLPLDEVRSYYPTAEKHGEAYVAEFCLSEFRNGTYLRTTARPLFDSHGNLSGAIESIRDITNTWKTEIASRESEAKYRTLFDTANDAIFIMDGERFTDCNPQTLRMFQCTRDQIIGQPPYRFSPEKQPDGRPSIDAARENITAALEGDPQCFEWMHCHYDGTLFDAEVSLSRLELSNKRYLLALVRDITNRIRSQREQTELKDKLERAQRMESLGILAGGVAHDLNNMLGPLVGYPELILRKLPEDSPVRKQVKRIGRAAQDAASVIQDLLTLARRGRYNMVPTCINEVIRGYIDSPGFQKLSTTRQDVVVKLRLDESMAHINGSAPHLAKVIMNLVVNAHDALKENGTVVIETTQTKIDKLLGGYDHVVPGEYILLRVRDNGTGIDPDSLSKIFEPYYSKKKMGASGSGLGLSVVYGIVRDHHGYYDVFSKPGEGTEFVLYFPAATAKENTERNPERTIEGTEKVLVVDDLEEQREIASELLSSLGYSVDVADGGRAAIKYLKENQVDIVLLDMIMEEDFDGLDTFREIIKFLPTQKTIIVSGYASTERVLKTQDLGAGALVRKPYTMDDLGRAIREELERSVEQVIA